MAKTNANLIWKIADLLRGPYQPNQYGDVILPFTILRRLDCILKPTEEQVLAEYKKIALTKIDPDVLLKAKFKLPFYNTSRWTFASLIGDPEGVADNLVDLHRALLPERPRCVRRLPDDGPNRRPGQVRPAVSHCQGVRRCRFAPKGGLRP